MNASMLPLMSRDDVAALRTDDDGYGALRTERGALPLVAMDVHARIVGTFVHTSLEQGFVNVHAVPLEATYIFPLPDRCAVTRFVLEVNGRVVEGELQERGQARATYDAAIAAGKTASIAEEERAGVFTLRVGNLAPKAHAVVKLELTGPLPATDGEVTFRFPLVVAPRYIPGVAVGDDVGDGVELDTDAVPDASRISPPRLLPGQRNPVRLGIVVDIDAMGLPLHDLRASLHHVTQSTTDDGLVRLTLGDGERLDRDFIVRFRVDDTRTRSTARLLRNDDGTGTLALTIMPPSSSSAGTRPRDVVLLLDTSGSMQGWKMVAARRAVARMVDTLRPDDRFLVIGFTSHLAFAPLGKALVAATDRNRYRAVEWIASLKAGGGTEMGPPLEHAARTLVDGGRDRVLVFVTDGQVGNEAQLLAQLGTQLNGTRVFALGIDSAVNGAFLKRLADLGRGGDAELVESEDRLDDVLARAHRRIDTPALRDVQLDLEGGTLDRAQQTPARTPDCFTGHPLVLFAPVLGAAAKPVLVVRGTHPDGSAFLERVVVEASGNRALRTAWGRGRVRDLEDLYDAQQLKTSAPIVALSLATHVLCRFTAFVAVDHTSHVDGPMHHVVQAVEQPAGWGAGAANTQSATSRSVGAASGARGPVPMPRSIPAPMPLSAMAPSSPPPPSSPPVSSKAGMMFYKDLAPVPAAAAVPSKAKKTEPSKERARSEESSSSPLHAWLAPLQEVLVLIGTARAGQAQVSDVVTRLRLVLEEMAHAGVGPNDRAPVQELLDALVRTQDLESAERTLRALLPDSSTSKPSLWQRAAFWK